MLISRQDIIVSIPSNKEKTSCYTVLPYTVEGRERFHDNFDLTFICFGEEQVQNVRSRELTRGIPAFLVFSIVHIKAIPI